MKINNKVLLRSLPMVAAVLGKEYGVRIVVGGPHAYTDGNTIYLPSIDLEKSPEMVNLVKAYADHEAAHIRHTNFYYVKNQKLPKLTFDIFNIIEDWRVEDALARQFPGCRHNFEWLIKHHFDKPIKIANKPEEIIRYILYSVRFWDMPLLADNCNKLGDAVEQMYPGLVTKIDVILDIVRTDCETTQHAVYFARRLTELLKVLADSSKQENTQKNSSQGGHKSTVSGQTLDKPMSDGEYEKFRNGLKQMLKNPKNAETYDLGECTARLLSAEANQNISSLSVAVEGTKQVESLNKSTISSVKRASAALHTKLQSLLQGSVLKRRQPACHGKLDTHRLYKISHSPRLFLRNEQAVGVNTSVHILFDCSGSMRRRIGLASQSAYAIAESLNKISGINLAVTVFPADSQSQPGYASVYPLLEHGEKLHTKFNMKATGTTPMGEAVWWALQQEVLREEARKIILIITDGEPDVMDNTIKAIDQGRRMGVEFYGVGIIDQAIRKLLGKQSEVINKIEELPHTLFKLLQNALLEKRK